MRTQFGKLLQKKSGDGDREYTDREKWIMSQFSFLKNHIVRVASRQAGLHTNSPTIIDTKLQELMDKLKERVEDSQDMRQKVAEMVKAVENHSIC